MRRLAVAVAAPAVIEDFEPEGGRAIQVSLEGESLFLLAPMTYQPLNRQRARQQLQSKMGVFKPPGRELKAGIKAGTSRPARLNYFAPTAASDLHPPKRGRALAPVIAREREVPDAQGDGGTQSVDQ